MAGYPLDERDLLTRARTQLPVPYRLHGQDLTGWDCLGCVKYGRRALFARPTPYGPLFYGREDADDSERRAALFEVGVLRWRPVERAPGAVVLFKLHGRPRHVGLMLTQRLFLHAQDEHAGTVISDLTGAWARQTMGFYDAG